MLDKEAYALKMGPKYFRRTALRKTIILWDLRFSLRRLRHAKPCNIVEVYRRFRRTCNLHPLQYGPIFFTYFCLIFSSNFTSYFPLLLIQFLLNFLFFLLPYSPCSTLILSCLLLHVLFLFSFFHIIIFFLPSPPIPTFPFFRFFSYSFSLLLYLLSIFFPFLSSFTIYVYFFIHFLLSPLFIALSRTIVYLVFERVVFYLVVLGTGDRSICKFACLVKRLCPAYNS